MFAFAIWDRLGRRLFCARDRAGEKPFHYMQVGSSFAFASELKSLVLLPGFRRELDFRAVADFLTLGFIPDPKTIWDGCAKLAPAHSLVLELSADGPRLEAPRAYWDLEFEPDNSVDDWGPEIRATLSSASVAMSMADVPVGTFLSGGVDSSSVVAALRSEGRPVRTFTIGFTEAGSDERPWARAVARMHGTDHSERVVDASDVGTALDRLHWHYDEPFNDYSYVPTYHVCREARRNVVVALSGDGGDEAFAGYRKYQRLALRGALDGFAPGFAAERLFGVAGALLPAGRASTTLRHYGADPAPALIEPFITGLGRATLRRVARGPLRAVLDEYAPEQTVSALLEHAPAAEVGPVNAMRYLDFKLTLGAGILVKVDRASMAVSLEVRPVYLHPTMLALAARIPPERLVRRTEGKLALKAALRPWLPDELLHRPKAGFAMPLGAWLRDERAGLSGEHADGRIGELVDPGFIAEQRRLHQSGRQDRTAVLHSFLFLQRWLERWL
jgi:asparagine synthase (glutamine-hydrolysing)